jgi:hypothetical protein
VCKLQENQLVLRAPPSQSDNFLSVSKEVNLYQMQLFHTFGTQTARTLIFGEHLWRNGIMPQSFEHDFLMHAILLMSATHSHHIEPHDIQSYNASVYHLSKTLRLFRAALSYPISSHNADALMATAILLYHHAWTHLDPFTASATKSAVNGTHDLDLSMDSTFTLSNGVKEIFTKTQHHLVKDGSIWLVATPADFRLPIIEAAKRFSTAPASLDDPPKPYYQGLEKLASAVATKSPVKQSLVEKIFLPAMDDSTGWVQLSNLSDLTEATSPHDREILSAYMQASCRLAPLLSVCITPLGAYHNAVAKPDQRTFAYPQESDARDAKKRIHNSLYSSIALYLFAFPVRSELTFTQMARNNDSRTFLILLYFYRAVKSLLSADIYWWSRPRADFMEDALFNALKAKGCGKILEVDRRNFDADEVEWDKEIGLNGQMMTGPPCFFQKLWTALGGLDASNALMHALAG